MKFQPATALTRRNSAVSFGHYFIAAICIAAIATGFGCTSKNRSNDPATARQLFEETMRRYHLPSGEAQGSERQRLLREAAAGYGIVVRDYSAQKYWAAQALRSLGNVRAAEGNLEEAVRLYDQVAKRYPNQDWETLQSWKAAGDLLWDARQQARAKTFYQRIVQRFDQTDESSIIKIVVRASKARTSGVEGNAVASH